MAKPDTCSVITSVAAYLFHCFIGIERFTLHPQWRHYYIQIYMVPATDMSVLIILSNILSIFLASILQSHGTELIIIVVRYSGTGQIRTQSLPQTSKGKVDKLVLTNNRIIQLQLFPKLVATQLPFTELNKLDTQKCKIKTFRKLDSTEQNTYESATKVPPWDGQ